MPRPIRLVRIKAILISSNVPSWRMERHFVRIGELDWNGMVEPLPVTYIWIFPRSDIVVVDSRGVHDRRFVIWMRQYCSPNKFWILLLKDWLSSETFNKLAWDVIYTCIHHYKLHGRNPDWSINAFFWAVSWNKNEVATSFNLGNVYSHIQRKVYVPKWNVL